MNCNAFNKVISVHTPNPTMATDPERLEDIEKGQRMTNHEKPQSGQPLDWRAADDPGTTTNLPFSVQVYARAMVADYPAEIEVILRLGAIANSLQMIGRRVPDPVRSVLDEQDAFLMTALAASYIYVALNELGKRHDGLWWKLAERGQRMRPLPVDLGQLRELLTKGSEFSTACGRIRDRYAFHNDREPFSAFLASDPGWIKLFALTGDTVDSVRFPASHRALVAAIPEFSRPEFVRAVTDVVHAFPYMVEAMIAGFNEQIREDWNREASQQAGGELK